MPTSDGRSDRSSPSQRWGSCLFAVFLLIFSLLLTRDIGHKSLVWDEAVIAQSGVDVVRLLPSLWDDPQRAINTYVRWFPYFPPFMSLILSVAYVSFGITEVVARSVSVCFGLLSLVTTFLLGKEAFDDLTGITSAILLSAMPIHWHMSRVAMLDVASVFFFTLTLYLYFRGLNTRREEFVVLSGFSLGLGVLTKYPNVLCVPVILFFFLSEVFREGKADWRLLVSLFLALEMAFFLVIPWFYETTVLSPSWIGWVHEIRPGTQYKWLMAEYWLGSLSVPFLQMTVPVGVLAVLAVVYSLKKRSRGDLFLLVWIFVIFLWFVPIHKDLRYTMPYLPALAILSGRLLGDLSRIVMKRFAGVGKEIPEWDFRYVALLGLMMALLTVTPVLYGLVTQPRDLRVPMDEAYTYVAENIAARRNVLILLSCNNFSQHASYFYLYKAAGLEASIHILKYPADSVDWYDPGPVNMTRIGRMCVENSVQYVLVWDGSPYSDVWLPSLSGSGFLLLEKVVGSESNAIHIFEFQPANVDRFANG